MKTYAVTYKVFRDKRTYTARFIAASRHEAEVRAHAELNSYYTKRVTVTAVDQGTELGW